jgi:hypothetical protein
MNATGCAFPYATDDLFLYDRAKAGSCDGNLIVWLACGIVATVLRVSATAMVTVLWSRRSEGRNAKNYKNRWPVVPFLFAAAVVSYTLFWVLAGLNLVSKGYASILICINFFFFNLPYFIYTLKFVKLGLKADRGFRKLKIRDDSRLAEMDIIERTACLFMVLSAGGAIISRGIAAPIFFDDPRPFFTGLVFEGAYALSIAVLVVRHMRRMLESFVL